MTKLKRAAELLGKPETWIETSDMIQIRKLRQVLLLLVEYLGEKEGR